MVRVMAGLAAWVAGTVIAVSVAWFGANVVVRNAGAGAGLPVVNAAVLPPSATAPPAPPPSATVAPPTAATPGPAPSGPTATSRPGTPSAGAHPPTTAAASPSAGSTHDYTLAGGRVTLAITPGSVQLVTAVPDAGYSVQTWSGTGWLRVDFSSGPQVSSLIASWYEHAPTITMTN